MRRVLAACALLALSAAPAHAQRAPVPMPSSLPATAAEVRDTWTFIGQGAGPSYVQPAAQEVKGGKIAWDAVIMDPPLAIGGKQILGSFYLREYDCAGGRERVLYWARLGDADIRWNQSRPTEWVLADDLMGDVQIKRHETVCPPRRE